MRETISKTVENEDVIGFAELSGDRNPIHLSEHFARKTRFGGRIVQTFNLRGSNMNRHSETSATAQKELTAKRSGIASIRDVQETETSHGQLNRIRELLVEHGADDEMLDAVDYLVEDNKGWINPEIAARLGCTGTGEA